MGLLTTAKPPVLRGRYDLDSVLAAAQQFPEMVFALKTIHRRYSEESPRIPGRQAHLDSLQKALQNLKFNVEEYKRIADLNPALIQATLEILSGEKNILARALLIAWFVKKRS